MEGASMYEKVKGLSITGKCFSEKTDLHFFPEPKQRIALIYGRNGSGKSTCAKGFSVCAGKYQHENFNASLIGHNSPTLNTPDKGWGNLFIFDEDYINKNVRVDKEGLDTIVLFGKQVEIEEKLKQKENSIKEKQQELDKENISAKQYDDISDINSPKFHKSKIEKELKSDDGWAKKDSQIKGNIQKSKVDDALIDELYKLSTENFEDNIENEYKVKINLLKNTRDTTLSFPNEIVTFKYSQDSEDKFFESLSKKIEEPKMTEREKLILATISSDKGNQVYEAKEYFSNENNKTCPYCYQPVSDGYREELIKDISTILNKDMDSHKTELKAHNFPQFEFNAQIYQALDQNLTDLIDSQLKDCKDIVEKYNQLRDRKLSNVFTPILEKQLGLFSAISLINELLIKLEQKRVEFNETVKNRKALLDKLIILNKKITSKQLQDDLNSYKKQQKAQSDLQKKILDLTAKLQTLEKEKNDLEQLKANTNIAVDCINNELSYVFFSDERLSIEASTGCYYLKSSGKHVKPEEISHGESNIIALCYFFTQIAEQQDIEQMHRQEQFIVIDDPVSSFDFENKIGIFSYLKSQLQKIISGNDSSKIIILSHDLMTIFHIKKIAKEICSEKVSGSSNVKTNFVCYELAKSKLIKFTEKNEYSDLLKEIYLYAKTDDEESPSDLVIGNIMRRVLEAFSTFIYKKSIENLSCDEDVLKDLGERAKFFEFLMYRLVLHSESHFKEQVLVSSDDMNFFNFISNKEKRITARNILCLMYTLQPTHITKNFLELEKNDKEIKNAITDIKKWNDAILSNKSADNANDKNLGNVIHLTPKRTIQLYDLAVSAGSGSQSFDYLTSIDYETENKECDYAVKVSGDSMLPNIKDGAILLIKNCGQIDNDKNTGIFLLNGQLYCKRLIDEDNKRYLKSDNPEYEPIPINESDIFIIQGIVIG